MGIYASLTARHLTNIYCIFCVIFTFYWQINLSLSHSNRMWLGQAGSFSRFSIIYRKPTRFEIFRRPLVFKAVLSGYSPVLLNYKLQIRNIN